MASNGTVTVSELAENKYAAAFVTQEGIDYGNTQHYGLHVIITPNGEQDNYVLYKFIVNTTDHYAVCVEYKAMEKRPCKLTFGKWIEDEIDHKIIFGNPYSKEDQLNKVTPGDWHFRDNPHDPDLNLPHTPASEDKYEKGRLFFQTDLVVFAAAGVNYGVKIERSKGAFPHIRAIGLKRQK